MCCDRALLVGNTLPQTLHKTEMKMNILWVRWKKKISLNRINYFLILIVLLHLVQIERYLTSLDQFAKKGMFLIYGSGNHWPGPSPCEIFKWIFIIFCPRMGLSHFLQLTYILLAWTSAKWTLRLETSRWQNVHRPGPSFWKMQNDEGLSINEHKLLRKD